MFNKQKKTNAYLLSEIERLERIIRIQQTDISLLLKRPEYFKSYDPMPDDSMEYMLGKYLRATMDYLGIDVKSEFEEDPAYIKPQPIMRKCYKAYKIKKSKPNPPR